VEMALSKVAEPDEEDSRADPGDFDAIVVRHQKQIYRVLLNLVRDADVADTLIQECFLRAFKKYEGFRGESSVSTWLIRIAINLAQDHNRSRRWTFWRRLARSDRIDLMQAPDGRRSPEQAVLEREQVDAVWSIVEKLPERQKSVFMLRFVEELSLESIAEILELEIGTVKAHLFRSVEAVKDVCSRRGIRKNLL
jgi:RNA polymerase sigma-70 factor, ECF subfamily